MIVSFWTCSLSAFIRTFPSWWFRCLNRGSLPIPPLSPYSLSPSLFLLGLRVPSPCSFSSSFLFVHLIPSLPPCSSSFSLSLSLFLLDVPIPSWPLFPFSLPITFHPEYSFSPSQFFLPLCFSFPYPSLISAGVNQDLFSFFPSAGELCNSRPFMVPSSSM